MKRFVKNSVLGVQITNETKKDVLEYIGDNIMKREFKCAIVTPNPEIVIHAVKHPRFKEILNKAEIALCDGVGLSLAGAFLGKPFKERITGVDFMKNLCEIIAEKPVTVGFLGGRQGVAEKASECLIKMYPSLKVVYVSEEFDRATFPKNGVDILFIAFGFPKQEEWVSTYFDIVPVKLAMVVGGSFDYISGRVPRAPYLFRKIGLEWAYRLIRQPWRWKRQLALLTFIKLVMQERMRVKLSVV